MPLTRDVTKIMVGEGALFHAPADSPQPADSVAIFAGWNAPWVHPGLSEEGVAVSWARDPVYHRVEEQSSPVFVTVNESTLSFAVGLAEMVLANLHTAMGGGNLAVTAAATGQIGKTVFTPSDVLTPVAIGFEARNPFGFFRRFYVPRAVAQGAIEMAHRRSDSKTLLAAEFQSIADVSTIKITDQTAVATA